MAKKKIITLLCAAALATCVAGKASAEEVASEATYATTAVSYDIPLGGNITPNVEVDTLNGGLAFTAIYLDVYSQTPILDLSTDSHGQWGEIENGGSATVEAPSVIESLGGVLYDYRGTYHAIEHNTIEDNIVKDVIESGNSYTIANNGSANVVAIYFDYDERVPGVYDGGANSSDGIDSGDDDVAANDKTVDDDQSVDDASPDNKEGGYKAPDSSSTGGSIEQGDDSDKNASPGGDESVDNGSLNAGDNVGEDSGSDESAVESGEVVKVDVTRSDIKSPEITKKAADSYNNTKKVSAVSGGSNYAAPSDRKAATIKVATVKSAIQVQPAKDSSSRVLPSTGSGSALEAVMSAVGATIGLGVFFSKKKC